MDAGYDEKYQVVSFPLNGGEGWERSFCLRIVYYNNQKAYAHTDFNPHGRSVEDIIQKLEMAIDHIKSLPILNEEDIG